MSVYANWLKTVEEKTANDEQLKSPSLGKDVLEFSLWTQNPLELAPYMHIWSHRPHERT